MSSSEMEKPSFSNDFIEIYENEIRFFYFHGKGFPRDFSYVLPKKSLVSFLGSEDDLKYLVDWRCVSKPSKRIEVDLNQNGAKLSYQGFDKTKDKTSFLFPEHKLTQTQVQLSYIVDNRNCYPNISDSDIESFMKQIHALRLINWFIDNVFSKSSYWVKIDDYTYVHKIDGVIHNDDGPAKYTFIVRRNSSGDLDVCVESAAYYKNGLVHREDGPAHYSFGYWIDTETKTVERKRSRDVSYFLHGNRFLGFKEFATHMIEKEKRDSAKIKSIESVKESVMESKTKENNFIGQLKSDSRQAGIRIACRKSVSVVQSTLIQLLSHNKSPKEAKSIKKGIDALFGSEYGKGLIGYIMGQALPVVKTRFPDKYQDIMEELATEFRVEGMAVAGEEALNSVLGLFKFAESGLIGAMTDLVEPIENLRVQPEKQEKEIEQPKQESVSAPEQSKQETVKEIGK